MSKKKANNNQQMLILCAVGFLLILTIGLIINFVRLGSLSSQAKEINRQIAQTQAAIEENEKLLEYLSSDEYAEYYAYTNDMHREGTTILTTAN